MVGLPFLESLIGGLGSQFGLGILSLLFGIVGMLICMSLLNLNIIYSLSLTGWIYIVYIINLGNQFFWLLGVLVIIYGIILFFGLKRLFGG